MNFHKSHRNYPCFFCNYFAECEVRDRKDLSTAGKQAFLDGLNSHAKEKGYKKGRGCWGWSLMQYEKKFGCSPSSRMNWGSIGPKNEMVRSWLIHIAIAHAAMRMMVK